MPAEADMPTKRADARKNIAAILEAATSCLAQDPHASVGEIARAAGVGRVTLYGHFESRSALIARVVESAMAVSEAEFARVELEGDPVAAMERLVLASWRMTQRYGALIQAADTALEPQQLMAAHEQPFARMRALLRRGRRAGSFRTDMPVSWQVTMIQSLVHGVSAAVHRGDHSSDEAADLLVRTVLGALAPPTH